MSVRSDLETRLEQWASSQSPPIEILKGWITQNHLQAKPILLNQDSGLSGTRYRDIGMFHINIWGLDGKVLLKQKPLLNP